MQTTTTLAFKDSRSGTSSRGPWTLSIFSAGDGREYTTLKGDLASKVKANDGAVFVIDYSERKNGDFTNYNLDGAEVAPEGTKPVTAPAGGGSGRGEYRSPDQIIRTAALGQAVEAFAAAQANPVDDLVGLLQTAVVFEGYIREGIEEDA